jgi:hypothetical protein
MKTALANAPAAHAHTPGDWYFYQTQHSGFRVAVKDGNSSPIQIATIHTSDEHGRLSGDDIYANARLISAAPKLMEALKVALHVMEREQEADEFEHGVSSLHSAEISKARAAIAAAGK